MAGQIIERRVTATYAEHRTQGTLTVAEYDRNDRIRRALRMAVKVLGVTALCIFIPGAHFVLVPLGIVLTPVLTFLAFRVRTTITKADIQCPQCGAALNVLSNQANLPLEETCIACSRPIRVALA